MTEALDAGSQLLAQLVNLLTAQKAGQHHPNHNLRARARRPAERAGAVQGHHQRHAAAAYGLAVGLPSYPSNEANPLYAILTGVTATTGTEPTGVCDDPPVAGLAKLCEQSYVFGRQSRMTRVFELDRLGLTTNRGEYYDFNLVGNPFTGRRPERSDPNRAGRRAGQPDQQRSGQADV
jgi:hypothetical protein